MRIKVAGFVMTFLLCCAAMTAAADYWPMPNGKIYTYEYPSGDQFTVRYVDNWLVGAGMGLQTSEEFAVDAEGDVLLTEYSRYQAPGIDGDSWWYEPPVKFLDLPLEVGKEWTTVTTTHGYGTGIDFVHYSVESYGSVTVPMGTFEAYVVRETGMFTRLGETYVLNRDLGPISRLSGALLVSITDAVATEGHSWGSIKALFR